MKRAGKWLAAAAAVVMCIGLASCGKEFDAAGYTKSVLDANYHGEYAEYAEYRDLSEKEAEAEIEEAMDAQVESAFAGQTVTVSDESKEKYKETVIGIMKLSKYEVKEAEKQKDDSYVVTVEIEPVDAFSTANSAIEKLSKKYQDDGKDLSDANVLVDILVEALNKGIEDNTYGEPVTVEVKVTKDQSGAYGIAEDEVSALESTMFPGM